MANFNEELFGCFSDVKSLLWAWCVPGGACCMQALAVDKATGAGAVVPYFLVACLACVGGAINRGKIRERFGIGGDFINDLLIWWCCGPCAACQEYREVQKRVV
jgi:Cys-rich protein (TIGR01571 family)